MKTLFDTVPDGLDYLDSFITPEDERALLERLRRVEFANFAMRGVVARRRVAFFGHSYSRAEQPSPPIPEFLLRPRARIAERAGVDPAAFAMALINEYQTGATIGWHRDAPQYAIVAGVSLGAACRMKFRPYVAPAVVAASPRRQLRKATHELRLAPRSLYVMTGAARQEFEHSIPAVDALRYSITFRTLRS